MSNQNEMVKVKVYGGVTARCGDTEAGYPCCEWQEPEDDHFEVTRAQFEAAEKFLNDNDNDVSAGELEELDGFNDVSLDRAYSVVLDENRTW